MRSLSYYKKNWKFFEKNRNPLVKFWFAAACVRFFQQLEEKKTYKMSMPVTFPFYNEKNVYDVEQLKSYYEKFAKDIAAKLDKRNGSDYFREQLELMTLY